MTTSQRMCTKDFSINNSTTYLKTGNTCLQQNTSHLERLHIRKLMVNKTKNAMDPCTDEVQQNKVDYIQCSMGQTNHAATGDLLGVVAHKWRQPLNTLSLIIQSLMDTWKYSEINDDVMERFTSRAVDQITLLNRTIDDCRGFFAAETTSEHFDPVESVQQVIDRLSEWFSSVITIEVRISNESGTPVQVVGCQDAFERIIVNLLCNANDAIEKRQQGTDTVSVNLITVDIMYSADNIFISVADCGGGIDEPNVAQIFKPYFTTKNKTDGLGLGLYLSRLIVENSMNGNLWFKNIPGGAQFNIRLPVQRLSGSV